MGELARKPGCPTVAETPLELLTPRPGEGFRKWEKPVYEVLGALGGVGSSLLLNSYLRRPLWASMPRHIIAAGISYWLISALVESAHASKCESDAVLKHYISLHPEDFPPFERKRWGEIYLPFKPSR